MHAPCCQAPPHGSVGLWTAGTAQAQDAPAGIATYPVTHATSEALRAWHTGVSHTALPALQTGTQLVSTHKGALPHQAAHRGPLGANPASSLTHLEALDARSPRRALWAQSSLKDRRKVPG